ncbi:MAG: glycosyltransferase family 2 protein [Bacteroidales bacterium]|nr:glycosyltransferase family 2 protein [Bacteroidales bacterium]
MIEISIVIPVYNSRENLTELHNQICDALKNISYELILVNDASKDNSWEMIKQIAENNKNTTAINLRKNFGQDNALMAGFGYVSGNYTVIMDDDLQHSPNDILKLYNKCKEGYDICYAGFLEKSQSLWKKTGSRINGLFAYWLLNKPKGIYMSPFKIVKSKIIKELLHYCGPFPYVDGLLLEVTNNLTMVEVEHFPRFKGKSNYNFIKSISVFFKLLTSFSVIPLRFATITGFISSFIGFVVAIYFLYEYYSSNFIIEGWTSLIISLLIIGGLLLMSIGLIGEYLGRMFLTLNQKPQYSIKEVISEKEK